MSTHTLSGWPNYHINSVNVDETKDSLAHLISSQMRITLCKKRDSLFSISKITDIFYIKLAAVLSTKHDCLPKLPFFGIHLTLILSNRAFDLDIVFSLEEIRAIEKSCQYYSGTNEAQVNDNLNILIYRPDIKAGLIAWANLHVMISRPIFFSFLLLVVRGVKIRAEFRPLVYFLGQVGLNWPDESICLSLVTNLHAVINALLNSSTVIRSKK